MVYRYFHYIKGKPRALLWNIKLDKMLSKVKMFLRSEAVISKQNFKKRHTNVPSLISITIDLNLNKNLCNYQNSVFITENFQSRNKKRKPVFFYFKNVPRISHSRDVEVLNFKNVKCFPKTNAFHLFYILVRLDTMTKIINNQTSWTY